MIFPSSTIGSPFTIVAAIPFGRAKKRSPPNGIVATIVNGEPIVRDGKLTGALPGQLVRPGGTRRAAQE